MHVGLENVVAEVILRVWFIPITCAYLQTLAYTARNDDIQVLAPAFKNPYSLQATLGVEQQWLGFVLGADYVSLRGRDLMSLVDINAPASNAKPNTRTVAQADLTRPTLPVAGGVRKIVQLGNEGESWYRALQVKD